MAILKDAIGAIDGSHVKVVVPVDEVVNHTCHHGYTSQNMLAICDFDMRFTFAVAGWPGSAHDTRILNHALENIILWTRVTQTELGILRLSKEARTIYQNFGNVQGLLKESTRCSISCIHLFVMSLKGLLES